MDYDGGKPEDLKIVSIWSDIWRRGCGKDPKMGLVVGQGFLRSGTDRMADRTEGVTDSNAQNWGASNTITICLKCAASVQSKYVAHVSGHLEMCRGNLYTERKGGKSGDAPHEEK